MDPWEHDRVSLPADHAWTARPGRRIVVVDRGAVRFDVGEGWTVEPGEGGSIRLHDRPPPGDDCRIEVSVLRLAVAVAVADHDLPPLAALLDGVSQGIDLDLIARSPPVQTRRPGLDCAWTELRHRETTEPDTTREALWRCCIARHNGTHAVLSMSTWADDVARFAPVWDELLETLEVGAHYDVSGRDPRRN